MNIFPTQEKEFLKKFETNFPEDEKIIVFDENTNQDIQLTKVSYTANDFDSIFIEGIYLDSGLPFREGLPRFLQKEFYTLEHERNICLIVEALGRLESVVRNNNQCNLPFEEKDFICSSIFIEFDMCFFVRYSESLYNIFSGIYKNALETERDMSKDFEINEENNSSFSEIEESLNM